MHNNDGCKIIHIHCLDHPEHNICQWGEPKYRVDKVVHSAPCEWEWKLDAPTRDKVNAACVGP